ncbi:hypothetical protein F5Y16DRAFT_403009 [Xylariaceae sp. FL0255]|nr:hypothetical protein F5Y16DRAFT_403009 [Xylariaceae sp. FL0255]
MKRSVSFDFAQKRMQSFCRKLFSSPSSSRASSREYQLGDKRNRGEFDSSLDSSPSPPQQPSSPTQQPSTSATQQPPSPPTEPSLSPPPQPPSSLTQLPSHSEVLHVNKIRKTDIDWKSLFRAIKEKRWTELPRGVDISALDGDSQDPSEEWLRDCLGKYYLQHYLQHLDSVVEHQIQYALGYITGEGSLDGDSGCPNDSGYCSNASQPPSVGASRNPSSQSHDAPSNQLPSSQRSLPSGGSQATTLIDSDPDTTLKFDSSMLLPTDLPVSASKKDISLSENPSNYSSEPHDTASLVLAPNSRKDNHSLPGSIPAPKREGTDTAENKSRRSSPSKLDIIQETSENYTYQSELDRTQEDVEQVLITAYAQSDSSMLGGEDFTKRVFAAVNADIVRIMEEASGRKLSSRSTSSSSNSADSSLLVANLPSKTIVVTQVDGISDTASPTPIQSQDISISAIDVDRSTSTTPQLADEETVTPPVTGEDISAEMASDEDEDLPGTLGSSHQDDKAEIPLTTDNLAQVSGSHNTAVSTSSSACSSLPSTVANDQEPYDSIIWRAAAEVQKTFHSTKPDEYISFQKLGSGGNNRVFGFTVHRKIAKTAKDEQDNQSDNDNTNQQKLYWGTGVVTVEEAPDWYTELRSDWEPVEHYIFRTSPRSDEPFSAVLECASPLRPGKELPHQDHLVANCQFVKAHTTIPTPRVLCFDETNQNILGHSYMIQERVSGEMLTWSYIKLTYEARCALAREIGGIYRSMINTRSNLPGRVFLSKEDSQSNPMSFRVRPPYPTFPILTTPFSDKPTTLSVKDMFFQAIESSREMYLPPIETRKPCDLYFDETWDDLKKLVEEMEDDGWFDNVSYTLSHGDLYPRNIMIDRSRGPGRPLVSGVIDWDFAQLAPAFVACEPPFWLWGWQDGSLDDGWYDEEREMTTEEILKAQNPETEEGCHLKKMFEEAAGEYYLRFAHSPVYQLARRLYFLVMQGPSTSWYMDEMDDLYKKWTAIRQDLTDHNSATSLK